MKDIRNITNREEIVERLADTLQQFDRDLNSYQTDVYMYIDEDTGAATLDTFTNVGGNSWRDDDHTTIYTDKEHFNTMWDFYTEKAEFSDCIGINYDQLKREVVQSLRDRGEIDEDEAEDYEPDYSEFLDYVQSRQDYAETLETVYLDWIDENRSDYLTQAEEIIRGNEEYAEQAE